MRQLRHSFVAFVIASCVLVACGSDDSPAAVEVDSTTAQASAETSEAAAGADETQPVTAGGDVDCAALKDSLTRMTINWQVVIGLTNSPSAEWADIPLGSIDKFGDQLAVITAAVGSDADAAEALSYMSGANDIVERGLGGDAAAQDDLVTYMGTDVAANVGKQLPIVLAYDKLDCE
jgi:hypothetical protein